KLLLVSLYRLTGYNFRAPLYFNAIVAGALACAMIGAAKRLRGWVSYADAFFPLLFLNWGGYDIYVWGFLVQLVCSTFLAGVLLLIILNSPERLRLRHGLLAGVCLVLLPFTGANGLGMVPALALWLGYAAARGIGAANPRARQVRFLILALVALA